MSEINEATPEELVEDIAVEIDDATVIPFPIDPTLTIEGEAADAKATGDAIRNITAASKVNNQTPDANGNITLLASNIPMTSASGAQTIAQAIDAAQAQTAEDILLHPNQQTTTAGAIGNIETALEGCTDEEIDEIFEDWEEEE